MVAVDVTANGVDELLILAPGDPLEVLVAFDAGSPSGVLNPAEVYLGVITPFAPFLFWVDPTLTFVPSPVAMPISIFTGALPSFPPSTLFSVPDSSVLPAGSYIWFMVVDNDSNGVLNFTFFDFVQTVVP